MKALCDFEFTNFRSDVKRNNFCIQISIQVNSLVKKVSNWGKIERITTETIETIDMKIYINFDVARRHSWVV